VFSHRADGVLRVSRDEIDVAPRHLPRVCDSLEAMLRLYKAAALYGVLPSPRVTDAVEIAVRELSDDLSPVAARLFLDILRCTTSLGPTLRSMYDVGLLERIIPDMAHARCLMQFNQYHHYTVDEHTLRAVEAAAQFDAQDGPVGAACRTIRHREILHLALLLHDLGKGFEEPHSDVGRVIAERMAARLHLPRHHADQLVFLVHKHLEMSHTALRRDITDPDLLVEFCRLVGTPENLRLLYVLTAADITAVGPGAWTAWKGELLADMFDRCLVILSGKHYSYHEQERLREIKQRVVEALQGDFGFSILDSGLKDAHGGDRIENPKSKIHNQDAPITTDWVDKQLSSFSAYYLTCTSPRRIAADLQVIRRLGADEIHIAGACDAGAVEYRVITRDAAVVPGCFHKMAGVLTAKRMEILSADINTTRDGVVVDSFRILDRDYDGAPPPARIADVTAALHDVLRGTGSIESLFRRHKRFGAEVHRPPISDLRTRVEVDNDSSDSRTVIEVFAHDRPGLLYTVTRTIYELNLSVDLAKISTYYDQVLDVFYVRETSGLKVRGDERLNQVREALLATLRDFEQQGYRAFVA
jgi:[protein-PII] uridylyltransferase